MEPQYDAQDMAIHDLATQNRKLQQEQDETLAALRYYEQEIDACREQRGELMAAMKTVHDTFVTDEAQGYRSRDRRYVIDILGAAIAKAEGQ